MRVLIAIDDSLYSRRVLEIVSRRHWPQDCEFKILTVIEPFEPVDGNSHWVNLKNEIVAKRREYAEEICSKARHRLERHIPGAIVHYEIREGLPAFEIVMDAADWNADKILIGAHGRGVCPHNLLGSVSRNVSAHAPCSVEIIRCKEDAHAKEMAETFSHAVK